MHARGVFAVGVIGLFAVPACDLPGEERPPGEDDDEGEDEDGEDEDGEESSDDGVDAGPVVIGGVISAFAEMTPIGGADVCFADPRLVWRS
jgi:hypothetical protein